MELSNEFEVALPVDEAWAVLTDVEKIAPCLPGAELQEVEGDEYRGVVKVKVGPITASYKGAARFEELDFDDHRAVLKAEGRETRGQGNASATITATLTATDTGTKVVVETDLAITGKVAQFGRGVLADVSGKLLDQFVHNLETTVLGATAEAAAAPPAKKAAAPRKAAAKKAAARPKAANGDTPEPAASTEPAEPAASAPDEPEAVAEVRKIDSPPAEPVDLVGVAGSSVARRLAPYLTVAGLLLIARIVVYSLRRRRRS